MQQYHLCKHNFYMIIHRANRYSDRAILSHRQLNDSGSSSSEMEEWKVKCQRAEDRVTELERQVQKFGDDQVILEARKKDLTDLHRVKEENKHLHSKVMSLK